MDIGDFERWRTNDCMPFRMLHTFSCFIFDCLKYSKCLFGEFDVQNEYFGGMSLKECAQKATPIHQRLMDKHELDEFAEKEDTLSNC
jgi:hypothetical protein